MVKKRFDETDSFINTVLTEANWSQANIKVKLNEETTESPVPAGAGTDEDEDEEDKNKNKDEDKKKKDEEDMEEATEFGYDACPLCESELDSDDVIFENIDSHFSNLLNIVEKAEAIQEGEDFDGEIVVESVVEDGCCPLCESVVEDDSVILANMNEHFDVVLEMLDELQESD